MQTSSFLPIRRAGIRRLAASITVLLLFSLLATGAAAQDEIQLRRGGSLEGKVIATTDSTVTLRVATGDGETRDAVLRKADIEYMVLNSTDVDAGANAAVISAATDCTYRNTLGVGLQRVETNFTGDRYSIQTEGLRLMLGYEYTAEARVWDERHTTEASRLLPSTYLSIEAVSGPYASSPPSSSIERIFGGLRIRPGIVLGGGFVTAGYEQGIDLRLRKYVFAGRADLYLSEGLRLRETVGGGWMKQTAYERDSHSSLVLLAHHRLDWLLPFGLPGNDAAGSGWGNIGYMHDVIVEDVADVATTVQINNGFEIPVFPRIRGSVEGQLISRFPAAGTAEHDFYLVTSLTWQFDPCWSVMIRGGGELGYGGYVSYRF